MPKIKIITEPELRQLVPLDLNIVNCIEQAFVALASGKVVMPPILSMGLHDKNGEVDVKTAYIPDFDSFAIKMSPGFFNNPKIGLPSTSGLMVLFSSNTGVLEALLLDNGYLTDVRTAAAGAVAARHLAPNDAETACVIGSGNQASLQLKALKLVRPIKSARIWGRDVSKARALAKTLSSELGIEVLETEDLSGAVSETDIIITSTPSSKPLVMAQWLKPGSHITAMGSDQTHKCELEPECLSRADCYVPDYQPQTEILGELRSAIQSGVIPAKKKFSALGEVVSGQKIGRTRAEDITIADLTGTGMQDTAIATFARQQAKKKNIGIEIDC